MTSLSCRACGRPLEPGEALRCIPVDGGPSFRVHRVGLSARCFRAAGTVDQARIVEESPTAAAAYDREHSAGIPDRRWEGRAAAAVAANTAVSALYRGGAD